MKSDFGKTFASAIKYAAKPKRMLPFFILLLPYVAAFLLLIDNASAVIQALITKNFAFFLSMIGFAFGFIVITTIVGLVTLYFNTLVVENSRRYWQGSAHRFLSEERKAVKGTFFNALVATIAVTVISFIASMIPFIGGILGIIVGLIFLTYLPACVLNKRHGLQESYAIFMNNKLETFVFWIVLGIISMIFVIIAFVPVLITLFIAAGGSLTTIFTAGTGFSAVFTAIKANLLIVAI